MQSPTGRLRSLSVLAEPHDELADVSGLAAMIVALTDDRGGACAPRRLKPVTDTLHDIGVDMAQPAHTRLVASRRDAFPRSTCPDDRAGVSNQRGMQRSALSQATLGLRSPPADPSSRLV